MTHNDRTVFAWFSIADTFEEPVAEADLEVVGIPGARVITNKVPKLYSRAFHVLRLDSTVDDNINLATHIDFLLRTLSEAKHPILFERLCKKYGSLINCAIYTNRAETVPSAGITQAQCIQMVRFNCALDIDILK